MLPALRPFTDADRPALAALLAEPGAREAYDLFQGVDGVAQLVDDPHNRPGGVLVADAPEGLAAFGVAHLLPGEPAGWAPLRLAVAPAFRRRGLGRALVTALEAHAAGHAAALGLTQLGGSAWVPDPAAEGFAAALGFAPERWFWLLERPRATVPAPEWPAGIECRTFDGSDAALEAWRLAYLDSFAEHYRMVRTSPEAMRRLIQRPGFRADGVALAWREGRVVGFARNSVAGAHPEVAILGTVRAARGIGLGRALLRWSLAWLQTHSSAAAILHVDGDNETALRLYADEGFSVSRRRRVWTRPLPPARRA